MVSVTASSAAASGRRYCEGRLLIDNAGGPGLVARSVIPKGLRFKLISWHQTGHSGRRGAQRDAGHRASAATQPMAGFMPPKAGCFCPQASLRLA